MDSSNNALGYVGFIALTGLNVLDGLTHGPLVNNGYMAPIASGTLTVIGMIDNNGTIDDGKGAPLILVAGNAANTSATLSSDQGTGIVSLTQPASLITGYNSSSVLTNGPSHTIEGNLNFQNLNLINQGIIQGQGTLQNLTLINRGTIDAVSQIPGAEGQGNLALENLSSITNSGTLEATGAGNALYLNGLIINNTGGTISGSSAGTVVLNNTTVSGGSMDSSNNALGFVGFIALTGANVLDGFTHGPLVNNGYMAPIASGTLTVSGTIDNNGTIDDGKGAPLILVVGNAANPSSTLTSNQGTGIVSLTQPASLITGYNSSSVLTNGPGHTIEGNLSQIENLTTLVNQGTLQGQGTIQNLTVNQGTIDAVSQIPGAEGQGNLVLENLSSITNSGTLEATGAGNALYLNGLIINNTGGTISGSSGGTVVLNNTTVSGGTMDSSNSNLGFIGFIALAGVDVLDGATHGSLTLPKGATLTAFGVSGSTLTLTGTIENNGTIGDNTGGVGFLNLVVGNAANPSSTLTSDQGTGIVSLTQPASLITGYNSSSVLTNGPGHTIEGNLSQIENLTTLVNQGTLQGQGTIQNLTVNQGTIDAASQIPGAEGQGNLVLENLSSITNSGTLEATGAGNALYLNGLTINNTGGTISGSSGGTVVLNNTTLSGGSMDSSNNALGYVGFIALTGTNVLDGFTDGPLVNNGYMAPIASGTLTVSGTFDNNGTIDDGKGAPLILVVGNAANPSSTLTSDQGTGIVSLTQPASLITGYNSSSILTNGPSHTIEGNLNQSRT